MLHCRHWVEFLVMGKLCLTSCGDHRNVRLDKCFTKAPRWVPNDLTDILNMDLWTGGNDPNDDLNALDGRNEIPCSS